MDEKELKTSGKQRFFIILIAVLMLGSIIASYAAIIINGGKTNNATSGENTEIDTAKIAEYEKAYNEIQAKFSEATKDDYNKFITYKNITAYNETAANSGVVQTKDLLDGTGKEIKDGDTDYLAYYIGWCADESVFDSTFDNNDNPTAFAKILDPSLGMIEGWNKGVEGMKIEGIREITISGDLAYGDSMEICGGTNKPLKFLIYAKAKTAELTKLSDDLENAYMRYQYANYGIDYDSVGTE